MTSDLTSIVEKYLPLIKICEADLMVRGGNGPLYYSHLTLRIPVKLVEEYLHMVRVAKPNADQFLQATGLLQKLNQLDCDEDCEEELGTVLSGLFGKVNCTLKPSKKGFVDLAVDEHID